MYSNYTNWGARKGYEDEKFGNYKASLRFPVGPTNIEFVCQSVRHFNFEPLASIISTSRYFKHFGTSTTTTTV